MSAEIVDGVVTTATKGMGGIPAGGFIIGAALVGGVIAGAYLASRNRKKGGSAEPVSLQPWAELQKGEKVLEKLDVPQVLEWARFAGEHCTEDCEMMLVRATKHWVGLLGFECPAEISPEHNVVAFVGNKKTGDRDCLQLFSFEEMGPKISELFGDGDVMRIEK